MRKLPGTCVVFLTSALVAAAHEESQQQPQPQSQQQQAQAARPKRPGVSTPGVKIPITRLKPDHVFDVPGVPDWLAIDAHVWVIEPSEEQRYPATRSGSVTARSACPI